MSSSESSEISDGALNEQLEGYLNARKEYMKQDFRRYELQFQGYGTLSEIDESVFLANVTSHTYVVAHFYEPSFLTCYAMNGILAHMASEHYECKFIKVIANGAPFFVEKLRIKTLPTVIVFKKGKMLKKFIGFEEFGMDKPDPELVLKALGETGALKLSQAEEKLFRRKGGSIFGADMEGEDW